MTGVEEAMAGKAVAGVVVVMVDCCAVIAPTRQ